MNPEDTTTSTVQDTVQAQEIAQPEELGTQAVQSEETFAQDTTNQTSNVTDSSSDEFDYESWLGKKGIDPSTSEGKAAIAKSWREMEKKMHETSQESKQLRESFNTIGQEQGLDDASLLVNRLTVTDFYLNNPSARQYDDKMAQIVLERPYLANDLDTVYKLARFESAEAEQFAQRQQLQKETLAQVAKAEVAAPPQASATTREVGSDEMTDDRIASMSLAEYQAWKAQTGFNPFVAN